MVTFKNSDSASQTQVAPALKPEDFLTKPKVGLFATCLVDLFRPSIGYAAVKLLEQAGCDVDVPLAQTCCGQPAFNSGDRKTAIEIAREVIIAFEPFDYVVAPSGSCAGMIKAHFPELFDGDRMWEGRAERVANKTFELVSFLVDERGMDKVDAQFKGKATYHDSCSGLRELGVKQQPRTLLESVEGLELQEMDECEVCCGFGGTFSVKYPDISGSMVERKVAYAANEEPDLLLAGDLGCLMNMAGRARREGRTFDVRHVAEVLAGMTDVPAIGRGDEPREGKA